MGGRGTGGGRGGGGGGFRAWELAGVRAGVVRMTTLEPERRPTLDGARGRCRSDGERGGPSSGSRSRVVFCAARRGDGGLIIVIL